MLAKNLKFIAFRLLENALVSQKIKSRHLYTWPQAKFPQILIIIPQAKGNYSFSPKQRFFENLFSQ